MSIVLFIERNQVRVGYAESYENICDKNPFRIDYYYFLTDPLQVLILMHQLLNNYKIYSLNCMNGFSVLIFNADGSD